MQSNSGLSIISKQYYEKSCCHNNNPIYVNVLGLSKKLSVSANCQRSGGTFQRMERALESICALVIPGGHFWRETSEWRILSRREVFTLSCQQNKGCGGS
ncbi:hypothetical protein QQF64_028181 [Cirrhinus molitorella]|uniref:Uncharacterized protein n=1 Tax=Cirrhinus molitorella TaxID=172907 RepID=A0ABR3N618_9TELE